MSPLVGSRTNRRVALVAFLAIAGVTTAVLGAGANEATREATREAAAAASLEQQAPWLANLKAPHRQLFDSPSPGGGIPLVHMMNFMDTYNSAFKVPDRDVTVIGTFYGMTTFHGLNDAMWAKYDLATWLTGAGADPGKGASANPWRTAPTALGMSLPPAGIESLQKRGAKFIICNNALTILSGMVAQSKGQDPKAVYEDMKANILPGVELVPAMVIAIEQAQKAGISYHRQ